jgi:hypothetical protein
MTTYLLIVGYILGVETTMFAMTLSPWWFAAYVWTLILATSGKTISRWADRWMKK